MGGAGPVIARGLLVVVLALLLAAQVVRNAGVYALSELHPASAARLWAGHPSAEISLGLLEIGRASRARTAVSPASFDMIDDAARKSPLSPEPYLVHGVQARLSGDLAAAKADFLAAQWRDPRSLPAAYFLAEYYFRSGSPIEGLKQTAILARLSPGGMSTVAPYVAAYAQNRANWPQIRDMFRSQPTIEDDVLVALAQNPANADAVLALADANHGQSNSPWVAVLLNSLVKAGQYSRARAIWASAAGVRLDSAGLIFDATFDHPKPSEPFNWTLTSSTVGLAERQPHQRLHAIFYGSEDGVLANELLVLSPGSYRMQFQLGPGALHPDAISWSLICDGSQQPFATITVDVAASRGWKFQVPPDCQAQWLQLAGRSADIAQQSDVTISNLTLNRVGGGG
jgi:tetratricopeptide (TPR) repeat protein